MKLLLDAAAFAAERHRKQKRKGLVGDPYVNHLIEVVQLLTHAEETDEELLAAAFLHDVVEDTDATLEEVESLFGARVRAIVEEVTDDIDLESHARKALEIQQAAIGSREAQTIKVADKISNLRALETTPPVGWGPDRLLHYCHFARNLVAHCVLAPHFLLALFEVEFERITTYIQELERLEREDAQTRTYTRS